MRRLGGQFRSVFADDFRVRCGPADVDLNVLADPPTQLLQPLQECADASLKPRVVGGRRQQHADPSHPFALLRTCRERPRNRRAPEQRDELAVWRLIIRSPRRHGRARSVDFKAERLRGLEVDDQLVFGRKLNRQIARLFAPEDSIDI